MAYSDFDSESSASSTTSLAPSVQNPEIENGRTYHGYKSGRHLLPNDEPEQKRLDLQHQLFLYTFGERLHICPINKGIHRVLDVGTGTGIWAIDFADKHPESHVIGVDLSPIQPEKIPPNVTFQIDDVEEDWTFKMKFDLIYSRMIIFSILNWPRFFQQSFENLAPGGYLEVVDIAFPIEADDDSLPADSCLSEWSRKILEASKIAGKPLDSAKLQKQRLEDAGFEDIVEVKHFWPQNPWAKDPYFKIGRYNYANIADNIEGISMALFTRHLGWTKEEVVEYSTSVREEMKDRRIHAYWPVYVVYGRKPKSPRG